MSVRILIAEDDAFRRGYVISGLVSLGATIVGPTCTLLEACRVLEDDPRPDAVIMSDRLARDPAQPLLSAVRRLAIPHLVLVGCEDPAVDGIATCPVLRWPFASFQVADWVISLGMPD